MYLQADHLFYQKFNSDMDVVIEQLTQHVQAVNDIYRSVGQSAAKTLISVLDRKSPC